MMQHRTSQQPLRNASKYLYTLFTYFCVLLALVDATTDATRTSKMVVQRKEDGDDFTNPTGQRQCSSFGATCVEDLTKSCRECECNPGNETYQFDLKRCVSTEELENYSGCGYRGLKDHQIGKLDGKLTTIDLTKTDDKIIQANFRMPILSKMKCHIANTSGFLNRSGAWEPLSGITAVLQLNIYVVTKSYLMLMWEEVDKYPGLVIKLNIVCKSDDGGFSERNCFLFKTTGRHIDVIKIIKRPTRMPTKTTMAVDEKRPKPTSAPTFGTSFKPDTTSTSRSLEKTYTYSVPTSIIIGVICGVVLVIIIIIILAIFCVRSRLRKLREPKQVTSTDAPKVHFTAQARFSLIQESAPNEPLEPVDGDYTCLKVNRESYDPYYSLRKDDVDLNVIDQVLKDAISTDSMKTTSEPRYSYRLSGDQTVIATVPPKVHNYNVLEGPDEPDYEEMESSDEESCASNAATKLLDAKPPLPQREYHVLEPPAAAVHSDC